MSFFGSIGNDLSAPFRMIHSFLNPQEGYEEAEKQAQQGWQQAQGIEQPFINQGQAQYAPLNEARSALMNPAQLENQWSQGYQNSPYAQQLLNMNRQSGLEAAGAMGMGTNNMMGSSAALNNIQAGAGNIVNQQRQQYLNDLMQKYMQGIGLGQNMYNTGANMGGQMGGQAMTQGENMAQLGYGIKNAPGEQLAGVMRMIASIMGANNGSGAGAAAGAAAGAGA